MTDMALPGSLEPAIPSATRPNLDSGFNPLTLVLFFGLLALLGFLGLAMVKVRWRTTWGAASGARV